MDSYGKQFPSLGHGAPNLCSENPYGLRVLEACAKSANALDGESESFGEVLLPAHASTSIQIVARKLFPETENGGMGRHPFIAPFSAESRRLAW